MITLLETGNWLMLVCAGFYLAWWGITFHPPEPKETPIGRVCLILAFAAGIAGMILAVRAINAPSETPIRAGISGLRIVLGGAAAYVILLVVTSLLLRRQVTSELLIITGWAVLELCALNFWYQQGALATMAAIVLVILVLIATAASLACYLLYYRLPYEQGYIIGCVPLIVVAAVMAMINLAVRFLE